MYTITFVEEENRFIFFKSVDFDRFHYGYFSVHSNAVSSLSLMLICPVFCFPKINLVVSFACVWALWDDPNAGTALNYVTYETYCLFIHIVSGPRIHTPAIGSGL